MSLEVCRRVCILSYQSNVDMRMYVRKDMCYLVCVSYKNRVLIYLCKGEKMCGDICINIIVLFKLWCFRKIQAFLGR